MAPQEEEEEPEEEWGLLQAPLLTSCAATRKQKRTDLSPLQALSPDSDLAETLDALCAEVDAASAQSGASGTSSTRSGASSSVLSPTIVLMRERYIAAAGTLGAATRRRAQHRRLRFKREGCG